MDHKKLIVGDRQKVDPALVNVLWSLTMSFLSSIDWSEKHGYNLQ